MANRPKLIKKAQRRETTESLTRPTYKRNAAENE